jgi:hypothetical protein
VFDGEEIIFNVVLARAEPVIGPAESRTRWLGRDDEEDYLATPISRRYFNTPG